MGPVYLALLPGNTQGHLVPSSLDELHSSCLRDGGSEFYNKKWTFVLKRWALGEQRDFYNSCSINYRKYLSDSLFINIIGLFNKLLMIKNVSKQITVVGKLFVGVGW